MSIRLIKFNVAQWRWEVGFLMQRERGKCLTFIGTRRLPLICATI